MKALDYSLLLAASLCCMSCQTDCETEMLSAKKPKRLLHQGN